MSTKANKPEVLAAHLETNVWNNRTLPPLPSTPRFPDAFMNTGAFTEHELMMALSRLKNREAPGPDRLPAEIWKYAPRSVHRALLAHFNKALSEASVPSSWKTADIVMIFKGKKKDPTLPTSYRPISLINTVYKIYASMLHHRLKTAIDDHISPVQFGFRAGKSTSTPLFVLRVSSNYTSVIKNPFMHSSWTRHKHSIRFLTMHYKMLFPESGPPLPLHQQSCPDTRTATLSSKIHITPRKPKNLHKVSDKVALCPLIVL